MCTVSFYPSKEGVIFTSNRDEQMSRTLAIMPQEYNLNNIKLYFPKDPLGGGSWFIVNNYKQAFILLNGAKEKHISSPPYLRSRGLVLMDLSSNKDPLAYWNETDLSRIEPFTIIAYLNNKLLQLRWDSSTKSIENIDLSTPRIWSSSTLYTQEVIKEREVLYNNYINNNDKQLDHLDLLRFHTQTNLHDSENGLLMNRNNKVLTKNVTQCIITKNSFKIFHKDLIQNLESELAIEL